MSHLISVIIPIYNVEKYLEKCIDSVINQTYKNLEIILIDDGSKDSSGKICDEYAKKDARIKVIHKENGGVSSARNVGLDNATGDYIAFVDSDDFISENFIQSLLLLSQKEQCDIAECNFCKFIDCIIEKSEIENKIQTQSVHEMQKKINEKNCLRYVVLWDKIYKKYIFNSIRFPVGKINEDEAMIHTIYFACKTDVIVTDEVFYYYRTNNNSSIMKRKFNISRLDGLDAVKNRMNYYMKINDKELYYMAVNKYQDMLKSFYFATKESIEDCNKLLSSIIKRARSNLSDYIKAPNHNLSNKLRNILFILFPKLYSALYFSFVNK